MKNLSFILLFLGFLSSLHLNGQTYNIKVQLNSYSDSTIYLGYYYGDKQMAKDTAVVDKKGNAVFAGDTLLHQGMYFVLLPGGSFFEVIIDEDQDFTALTKPGIEPEDLYRNLTFKGSEINSFNADHQRFMLSQTQKAKKIQEKLKTNPTEEVKKVLQDSLQILTNEVKERMQIVEDSYPTSLLASILRCVKEIEVPDFPRNEKGNIIDSNFQYNYYKSHYLDNIDFNDQRLIFTRYYHERINNYLERVIIPAPDTLVEETVKIIDKTLGNEEMFRYTLQFIFNKYANSNIMGMDKLIVVLADHYYLSGKAPWADPEWIKKLNKRVIELRPNLLGLPARNLQLYDQNDEQFTIYDEHADYTVLFFFEPSCGHCKKTTPVMKAFSDNYFDKGVQVIAIFTQKEKEEWIKFIQEQHLENWKNGWDPYDQTNFRYYYDIQSTPMIYLLDKNKRIIGKRLDVETLEKMLLNEMKRKK